MFSRISFASSVQVCEGGRGVFLFLTDFLLNLFSPQTLLFMRDETLMGRKIELYVLLKILKYCTNSPVTSFQCKFALDRVFSYKNIESMAEMGVAIKEILHYKTLRGKFSSVHPDLMKEGITRVEVGEEGLLFITNQETSKLDQ